MGDGGGKREREEIRKGPSPHWGEKAKIFFIIAKGDGPGGHLLFLSLIPIILMPPEGGAPLFARGPSGGKEDKPAR